jgi:hypothetical protein
LWIEEDWGFSGRVEALMSHRLIGIHKVIEKLEKIPCTRKYDRSKILLIRYRHKKG